jgi:Mitochondrial ribosomal protein subunit L20
MNVGPPSCAFRLVAGQQRSAWNALLPLTARRYQSSYRRTRSRLNIKPDASFLPSTIEPHDHIIYNPPPSAPNVYHTPSIFLPKTDRRRQLYESAIPRDPQLSETSSTPPQELPPPVRKPHEKRYHLTAEDMEEMRRLRREDPTEWSAKKLAKKFDCSSLFVGFVTEGIAKDKIEQQKQVTEVVKSRWGVKRRTAREDRALRKERWGRDG